MKEMNQNIGLVFSGGGGKGAYEIGVWKALEEFNVCPQIRAVSGSSVGALNAALFAQGDLNLAQNLWRNITEDDILYQPSESVSLKIHDLILSLGGSVLTAGRALHFLQTHGFFSRDGIKKLMKRYLSLSKISHGEYEVFAACRRRFTTDIRHFKLSGASEKRIESILLASSAIPAFFPPEVIDGEQWLDGGFPSFSGSNTPIKPIYDLGCKVIFAVLLNMDDLIDIKCFPSTQIIFIYPQESNGGFFSGTMDFDGRNADRRMEQGYADTVRILEPIYRMGKAQIKYGDALEIVKQQQKEFSVIQKKIINAQAEKKVSKSNAIDSVRRLGEL